MTYTTQAIVLKKIPAGEADAVVILYTRDFGKLHAYAQGVKKEAAKLKGHIEPFCVSMVQFVIGVGGERLTYAQMVQSWPMLRNDFDKYVVAHRFVELIDKNCLEGEKDEQLWQLLFGHLLLVEKSDASAHADIMHAFEKELTACLGYGDSTDIVLGTVSRANSF